MKSPLLIRVDGNHQMGLGHLVRSFALAHMLKEDFNITFFCEAIPTSYITELSANGIGLVKLDKEQCFYDNIKHNSIVVLDGYHFSSDHQKRIKATGAKLVCIDDLHDKEFVADLIFNHSPGITPQNYFAKPNTQFALGLDYAMLRPVFLKQAKLNRKIENIETVLICYGGSDTMNLTKRTLTTTLRYPQFKKIIVITGSSFQFDESLNRLVSNNSRIDHRQQLNEQEMLNSMIEAELAIVPSSGILLETLAAGCITISGMIIDNQENLYHNIKKSGLFFDAKEFSEEDIENAIENSLNSGFSQKPFINGNSPRLINKLFIELSNENMIHLRNISSLDNDLTYTWASNEEVRRFSINQHQISKQEHANWFSKKISDSKCQYFIVEYNNLPIGSIRFDIKEREAQISYLLDPKFQGKGFGKVILIKGIERLLSVTNPDLIPFHLISGIVLKNNTPSIKSFQRLGFVKTENENNYKFEKHL